MKHETHTETTTTTVHELTLTPEEFEDLKQTVRDAYWDAPYGTEKEERAERFYNAFDGFDA